MDFCPNVGSGLCVLSGKRDKSCGMEVKFAFAITVIMVELGAPCSHSRCRSLSCSLSLDKARGAAGSLAEPPPLLLLAFP